LTVASLTTPAEDCGAAVTGLTREQIRSTADEIARRHSGRLASGPVLIHDGPVGREAWQLTVRSDAGAELWVFATAGGTYSRPAGAALRGG
jgi:hypothetical protein